MKSVKTVSSEHVGRLIGISLTISGLSFGAAQAQSSEAILIFSYFKTACIDHFLDRSSFRRQVTSLGPNEFIEDELMSLALFKTPPFVGNLAYQSARPDEYDTCILSSAGQASDVAKVIEQDTGLISASEEASNLVEADVNISTMFGRTPPKDWVPPNYWYYRLNERHHVVLTGGPNSYQIMISDRRWWGN